MAKGLRASTEKSNRSKLRSRLFAPLEDARKDRLSAKLLELAAQPKPTVTKDVSMRIDDIATEDSSKHTSKADDKAASGDQMMDIDEGQSSKARSVAGSRGRIQKKGRGKARAAMTFPVHRKGKKTGPKLNARQRKQSLKPK